MQRVAAQSVPLSGVPRALAPAMIQLVTSLQRFLPCHLPHHPVGDPLALMGTLMREEQRARSSTFALLGVTSPCPAVGVVIDDTKTSRQLLEVLLVVPHQMQMLMQRAQAHAVGDLHEEILPQPPPLRPTKDPRSLRGVAELPVGPRLLDDDGAVVAPNRMVPPRTSVRVTAPRVRSRLHAARDNTQGLRGHGHLPFSEIKRASMTHSEPSMPATPRKKDTSRGQSRYL